MNYIKYTHFIKNKTFQKCALGGLAIFTLLGSIGYLVKNEFLPHFKNEENEDNKENEENEDNEDNKENEDNEDNKDDIEEDNKIKKQIDEIENNEKNNDNNLNEYIKNFRENQELLDSEALKEHLLEINV